MTSSTPDDDTCKVRVIGGDYDIVRVRQHEWRIIWLPTGAGADLAGFHYCVHCLHMSRMAEPPPWGDAR